MSETKTLHRNFWVWEFEKEERWLNRKWRRRGWALQNAGFCTYTFEKTEPGQYIIRLAMLNSSPDFDSFMEELEAQSVGHCFSWGYFRRSAQLGPFDLFSDVDSRISHLNKIGQVVRAALSGKPSHRRYQHLQRCIAGMAEPALRHVFGLRAGTYQQQTRESGGRTSAPRVIFLLDAQDLPEFSKVHFYPLAFRCRRVYYCHQQIVIMC